MVAARREQAVECSGGYSSLATIARLLVLFSTKAAQFGVTLARSRMGQRLDRPRCLLGSWKEFFSFMAAAV